MPNDWAAARAGVDVVIGSRSAAWAPCADLAVAVVLDEHDEALQEERTPTWHARDVLAERCRRAGVPLVLVSPTPTLTAVVDYAGPYGVVHPPRARERSGWPTVTVVDRSDEDPWKRSLVTSPLIDRLRTPGLRIVCVSNITGRARVLACRNCRALQRCERCDAAVGLDDDGRLRCRRCGTERPPVCQECGRSAFANLRPGVTRLREELEGAANRPVVAVTGASNEPARLGPTSTWAPRRCCTAIRDADVVAFLEFDSEMLAPRLRAAEHALALIARAGRIAPEVLVQTFTPDHEVLRAAVAGDPSIVTDGERARTADVVVAAVRRARPRVGRRGGRVRRRLVRSTVRASRSVTARRARHTSCGPPTGWTSGERLNAAERPPGSKLRIEVDPARV